MILFERLFLLIIVSGSVCRDLLPFTRETQKFLYDWQHPKNCSTVNWVTLIVHESAGIGSEIHVNTGALAWAINHNAIFLWNWSQWMAETWCEQHTFECVFWAPTNCTLKDLDPKLRLGSMHLNSVKTEIPRQFHNYSTLPFPLLYWWRAQSVYYLTHFNPLFSSKFEIFQSSKTRIDIPCGSVCAYVRHGDKGSEMELLPWRRFYSGIKVAAEISMLTSMKEECKTEKFSVFLMTDDEKIVLEAKRDFGSRLLFVDDSFNRNSNHPGKRNSTATEKMENLDRKSVV